MDIKYKEKLLIPTKTALDELSNIGIYLNEVPEILDKGFSIKKRKKNIIEKATRKGSKLINVVVVDMGNYYKLIHAGEFTLTKKFKKIMRNENEIR